MKAMKKISRQLFVVLLIILLGYILFFILLYVMGFVFGESIFDPYKNSYSLEEIEEFLNIQIPNDASEISYTSYDRDEELFFTLSFYTSHENAHTFTRYFCPFFRQNFNPFYFSEKSEGKFEGSSCTDDGVKYDILVKQMGERSKVVLKVIKY